MKLPLGKNPYFKAIEVLWSYWVLRLNPSIVFGEFLSNGRRIPDDRKNRLSTQV